MCIIHRIDQRRTPALDLFAARGRQAFWGQQGPVYAPGISAETVGAKAVFLGMVTIPPAGRTKAHLHEFHESAFSLLSGEAVELCTGQPQAGLPSEKALCALTGDGAARRQRKLRTTGRANPPGERLKHDDGRLADDDQRAHWHRPSARLLRPTGLLAGTNRPACSGPLLDQPGRQRHRPPLSAPRRPFCRV